MYFWLTYVHILIIKTLCMSLKNVFLWVYLVSIPEDGVSSQIEFDMGWNCVEVFLRYSGSWNSALARMTTRQPAFHFYWRPHFIFKWFFFSSLTFTWYRLLQLVSIRHLCSMHNFEYAKKEKDGTRRSAN